MKSLQWLDRRAGYIAGSVGIILGMIAPAALPVFASANALDSRSITMSSATAGVAAVSYELKATTETAIATSGGLIVEFCSDSPLIGTTCTHPGGLDVTGVDASTSTTAGTATDADASGDNATIKWVSTDSNPIPTGTNIDITFTGIKNPSAAGTFYARITTYKDATDLATYSAADTPGSYADKGGVALSTVSALGVTAYVQESMIFCVSHTAPKDQCTSTDNPSMTLGEPISGSTQTALSSSAVSTGEDYAQLSTNAAHGAVVNLHSSTVGCGGLVRPNDGTNCDIKAQTSDPASNTIAAGSALFGLTLGTPVTAAASGAETVTAFGALEPAGSYNATHYFLDYVTGDATGVTSTYGSGLFDSSSAPVSNQNIPITFGASVAPNTPAGIYGATLNMIAVGTF